MVINQDRASEPFQVRGCSFCGPSAATVQDIAHHEACTTKERVVDGADVTRAPEQLRDVVCSLLLLRPALELEAVRCRRLRRLVDALYDDVFVVIYSPAHCMRCTCIKGSGLHTMAAAGFCTIYIYVSETLCQALFMIGFNVNQLSVAECCTAD